MAIELIVEVLNHAPEGLTPAERLLLVVLAESADKTTRKCWPSRELIEKRTGLGPSGLKKVFQRLAERGLEVRIPIGKDKGGRLVFAHEGHRSEYLLPRFLLIGDIHSASQRGPEEAASTVREGTPQGLSGDPTGPKRRPERATQTVKEPSKEPSSSGRGPDVKFLTALLGATDEESLLIIKEIKTMPAVRNPSAYLRGMKHDDLRELLNNIRTAGAAETSRRELADHRARTATLPDCNHGYPGGHELSPSGWCTCPTWRVHLRKQHDPYDEPQDPRVTELVGGWSQ